MEHANNKNLCISPKGKADSSSYPATPDNGSPDTHFDFVGWQVCLTQHSKKKRR